MVIIHSMIKLYSGTFFCINHEIVIYFETISHTTIVLFQMILPIVLVDDLINLPILPTLPTK